MPSTHSRPKNLLRSAPPIHRARDYRLYSRDGRRLLDLYQANGAALLGHRQPRLSHTIKQRLSQGLYAALPSSYEAQTLLILKRLLRKLFPTRRCITIFGNRERAIAALRRELKQPLEWDNLLDPALTTSGSDVAEKSGAALWRPFLPPILASFIVPIVPFPAAFGPQPICSEAAIEAAEPDLLSPLQLAGLTITLKNLEQALQGDYYPLSAKNRSDLVHPVELFDDYALKLWQRRGPYLTITASREHYAQIFHDFLDSGFLISPQFPGPTILPLICPQSELKRFANFSATVYNGYNDKQ